MKRIRVRRILTWDEKKYLSSYAKDVEKLSDKETTGFISDKMKIHLASDISNNIAANFHPEVETDKLTTIYSYDLFIMTREEFSNLMIIIQQSTDKGTVARINNFIKHIKDE